MKKLLFVPLFALLLIGAACDKKASPPAANQTPSNTTSQTSTNTPTTNTGTQTQGEPSGIYQGDITSQVSPEEIVLTGSGTQGLDVDPETGLVYLGNNGSVISKCDPSGVSEVGRDTMSIVDPSQKKELARVATDGGPIWPTVDVERDVVYMAASGKSSIAVHKRGTGEKIQSITTGGLPHMAGIFGNIMVVSNTFNQTQTYYSAIDLTTRKVVGNHPSPNLPHPIVVDPDEKVAYMMGVQDGSVTVIDMTSGEPKETFKFQDAGGQLAISKKFGKAYTSSSKPGTTALGFDLETHEHAATASFTDLNAPGTSVIVDEEGGLLFIVIADKNALGVASATTLKPLGYVTVGTCPYGVRLDVQRGRVLVSNSGSHSLTMFDLAKVREAVK